MHLLCLPYVLLPASTFIDGVVHVCDLECAIIIIIVSLGYGRDAFLNKKTEVFGQPGIQLQGQYCNIFIHASHSCMVVIRSDNVLVCYIITFRLSVNLELKM